MVIKKELELHSLNIDLDHNVFELNGTDISKIAVAINVHIDPKIVSLSILHWEDIVGKRKSAHLIKADFDELMSTKAR